MKHLVTAAVIAVGVVALGATSASAAIICNDENLPVFVAFEAFKEAVEVEAAFNWTERNDAHGLGFRCLRTCPVER